MLPLLPLSLVDYTPGELEWAVFPPDEVVTGKMVYTSRMSLLQSPSLSPSLPLSLSLFLSDIRDSSVQSSLLCRANENRDYW